MNPNAPKHVTDDNIVDEDIKPEGRTDGPKNFGPEFTIRDGKVVPTRPAEQHERTARAVADQARADGEDEGAVVRSFIQVLPESEAALPASAQPIPPVVVGSMSVADRRKYEEQDASKQKYRGEGDEAKRMQYDIGYALATDNKALPLEASDALEEGYNDARAAAKKNLQLRREHESEDASAQNGGKKRLSARPREQQTATTPPPAATVTNPHPEGSRKAADFDAGAIYAHEGKTLPPDAPKEAREGYDATLAAKQQEQ